MTKENIKDNDYGNINIYDIYQNSIQMIIDVINDITILLNNYNPNTLFADIYNIIFKSERMFYMGILFIIISFSILVIIVAFM